MEKGKIDNNKSSDGRRCFSINKILLAVSIAVIGLAIFPRWRNSKSVGHTVYRPIGIRTKFTFIDLEKQQAAGIVTWKGKKVLNVHVDLNTDKVKIKGRISRKIERKAGGTDALLNFIKIQAEFLIVNRISDPEAFYRSLS